MGGTMAYTVKYRGAEIVCDTLGDVVAIMRELPDVGKAVRFDADASSQNGSDLRMTSTRFREFVSYLDKGKKDLLRLLVENPHGKTDESIRKALGLADNKQLGGFMSGIS